MQNIEQENNKLIDSTIPRWNLDSIYHSLNSREYQSDLNDYNDGMNSLDSLLDSAKILTRESNVNFDFPTWLCGYFKVLNSVLTIENTLSAYAYAIYSTDTTNTSYLNNISRIEKLGLRRQQQDIIFKTILVSHTKFLPEFYNLFPEYREYNFLIEETIEETKHQMSSAEENLATDLQMTGGNAWGRLHEQIISNLNDKSTGKTFNELRNDAYSKDAHLRKTSYLKEIELLKQNEIAFSAALNNLKGETLTLNNRRHWTKAIDRSLQSCRMSKKTLDALITSIEESLPLWRDYMQTKALLLKKAGATESLTAGTEKYPGLAFYDLFAPIVSIHPTTSTSNIINESPIQHTWTFSEAKDYIVDRYSSFSNSMGVFAKTAFENNWIDAEVRTGKVGGAYDQDFAKGHQSRILSNFTGSFNDVITLAHELGHAYHFSCLKEKDTIFFNYPMTLAETASTFAETIVKQDIISKSSDFEKKIIIETDLQDICQVLVDILCRYYFEQSVFEERSKGELNASDFCRLMKAAQEKSYGCGLNNERHEYMWAVKSHYYSTSLDFYNFPYAFGQLLAASLYASYTQEGKAFSQRYKTFLSNTGSLNCETVCSEAGFDITTPEFWKKGIETYKKEIELFKHL